MPTCVFLEREVYAFLSTFDKRGERVRGAMLRARIFLFMGGRRWTGRRWVAGSTCEELAGRATQEERRARGAREKRKKDVFLSLEKRLKGYLLVLQVEVEAGPQLSRP